MKLHELTRSKGLKTKARRKGRGNASKGNTAGRGHKGQKARTGGSISPFFEGGQTPLVQRMPKLKGFKRYYKFVDNYAIVNVGDLEKDERVAKEVTKDLLKERGYTKKGDMIKVLGNGDLTKKLTFDGIEKYSKSAEEKITAAGGKIKGLEVATKKEEKAEVKEEKAE